MYGGSPLFEEGYEFIYNEIKKDIMISSMPGGTEIASCFALANPLSDVWTSEAQGWGLGMKCKVFDDRGESVVEKKGELVCTASFPCQPLYFLDDIKKEKYKESYFNVYSNVWRHGDYAEITGKGGVIVYGRSDATLNPGGARIGTPEIYEGVEKIDEIVDSVAISQKWIDDERVILFVKLKDGLTLDNELVKKIKTSLREKYSANHVPAKIIQVKDIPYTKNGKKVEIVLKKIIGCEPIENEESLINPESLKEYKRGFQELETR